MAQKRVNRKRKEVASKKAKADGGLTSGGGTGSASRQDAKYKGQKVRGVDKTPPHPRTDKARGVTRSPKSDPYSGPRRPGVKPPPGKRPASFVSQTTGLLSNSERSGGSPRRDSGPSAHKNAGAARPGTAAGNSRNKVTRQEKKLGRKYAALLKDAKQKVDGKTMSKSERQAVVKAREDLAKMRKNLSDKGYGRYVTKKNKKGKTVAVGRGIYKSLTGKKASTITKKSEKNKNKNRLTK